MGVGDTKSMKVALQLEGYTHLFLKNKLLAGLSSNITKLVCPELQCLHASKIIYLL